MHSLFVLALLASSPADWWIRFNDAELNRIVEKTLANNVDLQIATQRIAEARATTGAARSRLGPDINGLASGQRLRGGFAQNIIRVPNPSGAQQSGAFVAPFETGLFQGGLDMKWELDLFGSNRAGLSAARADLLNEEQLRNDLAISLSAEAARYYFELRGTEERLGILGRNVDAQLQLLQLTIDRAEAGLATTLDVERQRMLLSTTEASLPQIEAERTLCLNRLAVLVGEETFASSPLPAATPLAAPPLHPGIPAEILKRRPDVRAAEARLAASMDRLKQARTDLYPKITLNGLVGRQGTSLNTLSLGGGNFFNLGPQLQLPIFNSGRIRANIAVNQSRVEQAKLTYRSEILAAFEEAANAIANLERQRDRERSLATATQSAATSLELAQKLQRAGLEDYLSVLDAQRSHLAASFEQSVSQTRVLLESVSLFKALAGGWPD